MSHMSIGSASDSVFQPVSAAFIGLDTKDSTFEINSLLHSSGEERERERIKSSAGKACEPILNGKSCLLHCFVLTCETVA